MVIEEGIDTEADRGKSSNKEVPAALADFDDASADVIEDEDGDVFAVAVVASIAEEGTGTDAGKSSNNDDTAAFADFEDASAEVIDDEEDGDVGVVTVAFAEGGERALAGGGIRSSNNEAAVIFAVDFFAEDDDNDGGGGIGGNPKSLNRESIDFETARDDGDEEDVVGG